MLAILARCANLYTNWTLWSPTMSHVCQDSVCVHHVTFTCGQFSERRRRLKIYSTIYTLFHTFKVSNFVCW